jgi:hypothetical protein
MSSAAPLLIDEQNLSVAWSRLLVHVIDHGGTEVSPLVLSISGFGGQDQIPEVRAVRDALDAMLRGNDEFEVATVANTIFPQSVWRIAGGDRHAFFEEYLETLPRYAALEPLNRDGTYFSRLIAYDVDARTGERVAQPPPGAVPENGNQLEYVIKLFKEKKVKRDSAFQVSIFDPARDHSTLPYKVFPCMQHLTFLRSEDGGGLVMNAFYATQQIVRKAYGNFFGLCRLGHFVAGQSGLAFERMSAFVGSEKLGGFTKKDAALAPVIAAARAALANAATPAATTGGGR